MEGNKDEAERCIEIGIASLKTGNIERAEKFLRKAESLFPTQRAKTLLASLQTAGQRNSSSNATKTEGPKRRTNVPTAEPTPVLDKDYTKTQLEMVQRIKRCKDYYEVLNVNKECTDSEIKKSYKKLALQLHPDKNRAPGAVEAFKAVGNAVAVLTDAQKRKAYDMYGAEGSAEQSSYMRRNGGGHNHEYEHAYNRGGFESDFTAEELFNMFFGNAFPQQRMDPRARQHHHQRQDTRQQPSMAFGLILVLIIISMLSSFFTTEPVYSLSASTRYPVARRTIHLGVPYFVREKFDSEYQGSLSRLENSVEEEYIAVMKQGCFRERNYREMMISRARSYGSQTHFKQAQDLKVPSCEKLASIGITKYMPY